MRHLDNYYTEQEALFGITPSMAIEKTKAKLKEEAELVEGITLKMKSYIGDIEQVIDILDI